MLACWGVCVCVYLQLQCNWNTKCTINQKASIEPYNPESANVSFKMELLYHVHLQIGLIGLVEEEWLVTLTTIDRENLTYIDFVEQGRKLARQLKQQVRC